MEKKFTELKAHHILRNNRCSRSIHSIGVALADSTWIAGDSREVAAVVVDGTSVSVEASVVVETSPLVEPVRGD